MKSDQPNHYDVLGVAETADTETIKRAYRERIRRHHPDQHAAERTRLKRSGNSAALYAVERRIEEAKKQTQRINTAYAVLSDAARRADYDRQLRRDRQPPKPTYSAPARRPSRYADEMTYDEEYERRTVKARPHKHPRAKQPVASSDAAPWLFIGGLFVVLVILAGFLSSIFEYSNIDGVATAVDATSRPGYLTAHDLQATAIADNLTQIAREERLRAPTSTPRSRTANISAGDRFYAAGSYELAIEGYTLAIAADDADADLYHKRGLAYVALSAAVGDDADWAALTDFNRALTLDSTHIEALGARGLLYYRRWQASGGDDVAAAARADLRAFVQSGGEDASVNVALSALGS